MKFNANNKGCLIMLKKHIRFIPVYLFSLCLCLNINAAGFSVTSYEGKQDGMADKNIFKVDVLYYKNFPYRKSYANKEIKNCIKMPSAGIVHCKEFISLIRSKNTVSHWLRSPVKGSCFNLPSKEFGVNHTLGCISKITPIDFLSVDKKVNAGNSFFVPVTGLFIRHVSYVRQYTFKNVKTNIVFSVKATPEHPVYSVSRHVFVPVSKLLPEDVLLAADGEKIQLLCRHGINQGIKNSCSIPVNKGEITSVYNIETNHRHTYFVQDGRLLVHNCNGGMGKAEEKINASSNGQSAVLKGTSTRHIQTSGKEKQVRLIGLVGGMGGETISDVIMSEPYALEYVQELKQRNPGKFLYLHTNNDKQAEVLGIMDDFNGFFCGYSELERLSWQNERLARRSLFGKQRTLVTGKLDDFKYMEEFHAQQKSWPFKWPWQEGGSWVDCAAFSFFGGAGAIVLTGGIASAVVSEKDDQK